MKYNVISLYLFISLLIFPLNRNIPIKHKSSFNYRNNNISHLIFSIFQEHSPLIAEILNISQITYLNFLRTRIPIFISNENFIIEIFLLLNYISPSISSNASHLLLNLIINNRSLRSILNTLITNTIYPLSDNDKAKLVYIITLLIIDNILKYQFYYYNDIKAKNALIKMFYIQLNDYHIQYKWSKVNLISFIYNFIKATDQFNDILMLIVLTYHDDNGKVIKGYITDTFLDKENANFKINKDENSFRNKNENEKVSELERNVIEIENQFNNNGTNKTIHINKVYKIFSSFRQNHEKSNANTNKNDLSLMQGYNYINSDNITNDNSTLLNKTLLNIQNEINNTYELLFNKSSMLRINEYNIGYINSDVYKKYLKHLELLGNINFQLNSVLKQTSRIEPNKNKINITNTINLNNTKNTSKSNYNKSQHHININETISKYNDIDNEYSNIFKQIQMKYKCIGNSTLCIEIGTIYYNNITKLNTAFKYYRNIMINNQRYTNDIFIEGLNIIIIKRNKTYSKLYENTFISQHQLNKLISLLQNIECDTFIIITIIGNNYKQFISNKQLIKQLFQFGLSIKNIPSIFIGRRGLCKANGITLPDITSLSLKQNISLLGTNYSYTKELSYTMNLNNDNRFNFNSPTICDVYPRKGSYYGGQNITITALNIGNNITNIKHILVKGIKCINIKLLVSHEENIISCTTKPNYMNGSGVGTVEIELINGSKSPHNACNYFEYVNDYMTINRFLYVIN